MEGVFEKPVVATIGAEKYECLVQWRHGEFIADEPERTGGKDMGPDPMTLMLASLGTCTLVTLRMYIDRKEWDISEIAVALNMHNVLEDGKKVTIMSRDLQFFPPVTNEQRERLLQVAKVCPVSKMLEAGVQMDTTVAGDV